MSALALAAQCCDHLQLPVLATRWERQGYPRNQSTEADAIFEHIPNLAASVVMPQILNNLQGFSKEFRKMQCFCMVLLSLSG